MNKTLYFRFGTVLLCAAVFISLIFNNNLWMDEAFSATLIRDDFGSMLSGTAADTLPPFYNIAAWCFTRIFGFSAFTLKLFSVIPMIGLMVVAMVFIPGVSSTRSAFFYVLLITSMPHMLEYGVEIRMYSWALFFASAAAIFAVCLIKKVPHSMIYLIICTVLGAYTHQYALMAEAMVWLMLLVIFLKRKEFTSWLKGALICFILYIPCAILTVYQMNKASSYFSASEVSLNTFLSTLRFPFVTNVTPVSLFLLIFVGVLFVISVINRDLISSWYMMIFVILTLISYLIMIVTGSTFFSARYLLPSIGILWLGAALATDHIPHETYSRILLILIPVFILFLTYRAQLKDEYKDSSDFEKFIADLNENDGYLVYEDFPEIQICFDYYAPAAQNCNEDSINTVSGDRFIIINDTYDTKNLDLSQFEYVGDYTFDRYKFKAYIMH